MIGSQEDLIEPGSHTSLICGLWIKAQPEVDPSSVSFHLGIALLTSGFVVVSLLVSTVAVFRLAA
jgi:hypothetical protein